MLTSRSRTEVVPSTAGTQRTVAEDPTAADYQIPVGRQGVGKVPPMAPMPVPRNIAGDGTNIGTGPAGDGDTANTTRNPAEAVPQSPWGAVPSSHPALGGKK